MKLLKQKSNSTERLGKFSAYEYCKKNKKPCSGENTKVVAGKLFDKDIMGVTCGFNQPSQ